MNSMFNLEGILCLDGLDCFDLDQGNWNSASTLANGHWSSMGLVPYSLPPLHDSNEDVLGLELGIVYDTCCFLKGNV